MDRNKNITLLTAELEEAEQEFTREVGSSEPDYEKIKESRAKIDKVKRELMRALVTRSQPPDQSKDIKKLSDDLDRTERAYTKEIGGSTPDYRRIGEIRANISRLKRELILALEFRVHEPSPLDEKPPSPPSIPPALTKAIRDGQCILFAGAGASIDAGLPSWPEMVADLVKIAIDAGTIDDGIRLESLDLLAAGELPLLAEFFSRRLVKHDIAKYLQGRLSLLNRTSNVHRLLARIPFKAAITINFDPFIEGSKANARVILPDQMEGLGSPGLHDILNNRSRFPVIKMHGSYDDPSSIILTHEDFRELLFAKNKYREFLLRLFTDSTLFFYGYGFRDPNVDFTLQKVAAMYKGGTPAHYALLPEPCQIKKAHLNDSYNVRVIPYRIWEGNHHAAIDFLERLADEST